ncbi:obg family GTPase CgtA [Verruconis gallopava]|uniref:Obg family GTPase CgtA n=1 Tax=Verruconis gallopava TaxID=253628 RepID=A0A0D1XNE9_9PEZI|nr:obg family GTPase CgtA [Verruconis gallopava]KIW04101.1 obg family GTPase CgtA [Verruconis gallopava]
MTILDFCSHPLRIYNNLMNMSVRPSCLLQGSLMPFLYPFSKAELFQAARYAQRFTRVSRLGVTCLRQNSTLVTQDDGDVDAEYDRLNPTPDDFSATPFTDHCTITVEAGSGGNGCISFLREKFIANGPPNGGDGGTGGNVYIQAVRGETSLHKVARRREVKAGRGRNGQGSNKNGQKGTDVVITVPVGTVVRELARHDPVTVEEEEFLEEAFERRRRDMEEKYARKDREKRAASGEIVEDEDADDAFQLKRERRTDPLEFLGPTRRDKFLMYPGEDPSRLWTAELPRLPEPRRSNLARIAPEAPITLDLDSHMETPVLIAPGAMGGYGNPYFVTKDQPLPKIATKGDGGVKIVLHLELKLLADVGLVGLPNAGKSTLLRAVSNSRARVGNWAFTTLRPNIGTVVLDDYKGRSNLQHLSRKSGRTRFTIADIPGVIEDAHMDKGLGLSFLRHIERARVLAFVIDLSAGDAVKALQALWTEVAEYENLGSQKHFDDEESPVTDWQPTSPVSPLNMDLSEAEDIIFQAEKNLPPLTLPPMSSKPWFVVGTKADLPDTQDNFLRLQRYLHAVQSGKVQHPSGKDEAWKRKLYALPISGIRGEGVNNIPEVVIELLLHDG